MRTLLTTLLCTSLALPAAAQGARPGLPNEPEITEGLIAVGMAYEIDRQCDALDARKLTGITTLLGLKGRARDLGYSSAEVDAFIDDDAEKERLKVVARARLAALGAAEGDEASWCAVGRSQIDGGTAVGRLLR